MSEQKLITEDTIVTPELPDDIGDNDSRGWYYEVSKDHLPKTTEHFLQMEKKDEALLIAALEGMKEQFIEQEFIYSFKQGGRDIIGITANLVREIIQKRGMVETYDPQVQILDEMIYVTVRAKDLITNVTVTGSAEHERGKPFDYRKAVNMAERNAWRKLIREPVIRWILAQHIIMKEKMETIRERAVVKNVMYNKKFNKDKMLAYLKEKYDVVETPADEMTLQQWQDFSSFIVTKNAQQLFT